MFFRKSHHAKERGTKKSKTRNRRKSKDEKTPECFLSVTYFATSALKLNALFTSNSLLLLLCFRGVSHVHDVVPESTRIGSSQSLLFRLADWLHKLAAIAGSSAISLPRDEHELAICIPVSLRPRLARDSDSLWLLLCRCFGILCLIFVPNAVG